MPCGNAARYRERSSNIAGHWDYPEYERTSPVRDGLNALDVSSLGCRFTKLDVFRNCARDPAQLERLYDTCELPSGFTQKDFVSPLPSGI